MFDPKFIHNDILFEYGESTCRAFPRLTSRMWPHVLDPLALGRGRCPSLLRYAHQATPSICLPIPPLALEALESDCEGGASFTRVCNISLVSPVSWFNSAVLLICLICMPT